MRIVLFGTGECARSALNARRRGVEVVAASDNNAKMWGQRVAGVVVVAPADISTLSYDYVVVCSSWAADIIPALVERGIARRRILSCYRVGDDEASREKELSILDTLLDVTAVGLPDLARPRPKKRPAQRWSWRDGRSWYRWFRWLPISRRIAFFDSYWGNGYSCNPRAISEHLSTVSDGRPWKLVWGLNDPSSVHAPRSVVKVKRLGLAYHYYAARAGLLVTNVNFPDHIEKRPRTLHIQTMHGTPIKTLGVDIPGEFASEQARTAFLKRCERWDYLTAPGHYTAGIARRAFQFSGTILPTGYPRNDYLFSGNTPAEIARLRRLLAIPESRKVILFAPTWRGAGDDAVAETARAVLKSFAADPVLSKEYVLLLRFHHLMKDVFRLDEATPPNVIDASTHPDNRELLLVADALITDYSSIVFDYALLERPIVLCCLDYRRYANETRGVYLDIEQEAPWPVYHAADEVAWRLRDGVSALPDLDAHRRFIGRFGEWERGDACAQLYNDVIRPAFAESMR
jgi:CDP-glycerol glycerophosphotransferase